MIPTEKQKCIAEQAIYGDLAIRDKDCFTPNYEIVKGFAIEDNHFCIETNFEESRILTESDQIILRPLNLTKEITHRGYNENQPFIPLVELAKIAYPDSSVFNVYNNTVTCYNNHSDFEDGVFNLQSTLDIDMYDLLNRLHFDTRNLLKKSEAISTNEINPYEVK